MNTDHEFDPNNLAQVTREIFIHLMNAIPETDMDREAAFWQAQQQLVLIRKQVDVAHRRAIHEADGVLTAAAIALVLYERVVVEGLSAQKAADMSSGELIQQADEIQPVLEAMNLFKRVYINLLGWKVMHGVKVA